MKAKDVMAPFDEYLVPGMPLREAAVRIRDTKRQHGLSVKGMVVLDERKKLVGMLSIKDIMRAAIPQYLSVDLGIFSWDTMLEEMTERIKSKVVADVMIKKVITVPEESPLMLCVDLMIRKGLQRLPVINDAGEITGIVYIRDIFNLIADILTGEEYTHGSV